MLDSSFGNWLSGFVDGEGCFGIYPAKSGHSTAIVNFSISLRDDDRNTIDMIQRELGVGRVQHQVRNGTSHPQSKFLITNTKELAEVLIPILDRYPLRTKKRQDYILFREAIMMRYETLNKTKNKVYWEKFYKLVERLKDVKNYVY